MSEINLCGICEINPATMKDFREEHESSMEYYVCGRCLHISDEYFWRLYRAEDKVEVIRTIISVPIKATNEMVIDQWKAGISEEAWKEFKEKYIKVDSD